MSDLYGITNPRDIELVDSEIEINIDASNASACCVIIPAKMIFALFTEEQLAAIIGEIEAKRGLESHAPSPEAD